MTKIIIETVAGINQEDWLKYMTEHGAYHYLKKPITLSKLKKVMKTFEEEETIIKAN